MIKFTDEERESALEMLADGVANIDRLQKEIRQIMAILAAYEKSGRKLATPSAVAAQQVDLGQQDKNMTQSRAKLVKIASRIRHSTALTEQQADQIVKLLGDVRKSSKELFASSDKYRRALRKALEDT